MTATTIAIISFVIILLYIFSKLFEFYGIGSNVYGYYMAFYAFMMLSLLVLPTSSSNDIFEKL